ncbi:hypothetical protein OF83DRAFT_1165952 [Amylostereum chailletii]|nr:hypothetical protein OF83DRAFT_1165952 [Amylostereum chailletii]
MISEESTRRILTLVQYCQKDSVAYELVRPVLENCSRNTLCRLEEASPKHCCDSFRIQVEPYLKNPPPSWRDQFYLLEEDVQRRFQAAGENMRINRIREEERRKERDVKMTDKVPPVKRARWGAPSQPKSLLQKTRTQASKVQKIFSPQQRPPMPASKSYRVVANTISAKPPPPPNPVSSSPRVTVKTVTFRQPPKHSPSEPPQPQSSTALCGTGASLAPDIKSSPKPAPLASPPAPSTKFAPILNGKKGPTSSLFMPKHRAHSQLPNRLTQSRA